MYPPQIVEQYAEGSDGGSVEFHNRSLVGIGWYISCDFAD